MNLFIFITFCGFLGNAAPQYYYVGQPAVFHIPQQYNAFSHPFSTYHVNPHFQQFRTVPAPLPPPTPAPAPVHRPAFQNDAEYRGFAYHTRTDNGATSHVLFVTGPQAQQVNSRVFNNFNAHTFGQNNDVNQARTVASEMIDPVKKTEPEENVLPKNIQDLYTPPAMQRVENNDPFQYFQSVFQNHNNPSTRLINFYSRNTNLFAEQVPGYPANVAPLSYNAINPRFLATNDESNNRNDSLNSTDSTTEKQATEDKKSDSEVAAESVITNTRFRLNDIHTNENGIFNFGERVATTDSTVYNFGDRVETNKNASTIAPSSGTSEAGLPSPSTQRAETFSQRPFNNSNEDMRTSTTSSSSSSEEDSAMISNSTNILSRSGPLSGISTTLPSTNIGSNIDETSGDLLVSQRLGSQSNTLAQTSVSLNETPSSSSSDQSTSDSLRLKSPNPSSQSKDSTHNVTEIESSEGFLNERMAGVTRSIEAITTSSSESSVSSTSYSTSIAPIRSTGLLNNSSSESTIASTFSSSDLTNTDSSSEAIKATASSTPSLSEYSNKDSSDDVSSTNLFMTDEISTLSQINDAITTEFISTVDTTTDQMQLTTNNNNDEEDAHLFDVITTKTIDSNSDLARLVESLLDATTEGGTTQTFENTTSTAGNSNEENLSISTDAMMSTTSQ